MAVQPRRIPTPEQIVLAIAALGEDATGERVTQLQAFIAVPHADQPARGLTLAVLTEQLAHARLVTEGRLGDAKARLRAASSRAHGGPGSEQYVLDAIRLNTRVEMCNWALEMLPDPSAAPVRRGAGPETLTVESLAVDINFARRLFAAHIGSLICDLADGDLSAAQVPRVGEEAIAELGAAIDTLGQVLNTIPEPTGTIARQEKQADRLTTRGESGGEPMVVSSRAGPSPSREARISAAFKAIHNHATALGLESDEATLVGELAQSLCEFCDDEHISRRSFAAIFASQEVVAVESLQSRATEVPVGNSTSGGGTNHPGRPEREGQLAVFQSPYARDALLVDIAEADRCGDLRWVALSDRDPRYQQAIADAREQKTAGAAPAARQDLLRETDEGFPYIERRMAGVVVLHATAGHQEFLVPQGANEPKWFEQTAVHHRREAENLIEQARQLTARAECAEMAAALCKPATPEAEQNASSASPDL